MVKFKGAVIPYIFFPRLECNEALDIHRHSIGSIHSTLNTLSIEIHLRKGNVITAASVHLEDIRREDQQIQIRARISNRLVQINHFKVTNCLQILISMIIFTSSLLVSLRYESYWLL